MEIKAEKRRTAKKAAAVVLAAAIILSSSTAAALSVVDTNDESNSTNTTFNHTIEYELLSGDLLVANNDGNQVDQEIIKAKEVKVITSSGTKTVKIAKGTVEDALRKAEITLEKNQIAYPVKDTEIYAGMEINIFDCKTILIKADGKVYNELVPYGKISDMIEYSDFKLGENDILSVSKDNQVKDIETLTVKRVTYSEEQVTEKISYKTVKKNSKDVELGKTKVKTDGKNGEKLVTKRVKYIDGKRSGEDVISEEVVKEPVNKEVLIGIKGAKTDKVAGTFVDHNGNTVAYSRVVNGSGTAYTAPAGALTATGVAAYHGGVAVNPNIIPYGSKLYITSTDGSVVYGYATAVDTGGALMAGTAIVDCFYNTYGECVNFGRRNVNVYIIG